MRQLLCRQPFLHNPKATEENSNSPKGVQKAFYSYLALPQELDYIHLQVQFMDRLIIYLFYIYLVI